MPRNSTFQDAIRLLYIFVYGADPLKNHPDGYVSVFEGKTKLHALDFWVRYPDFLAWELLNRYEDSGDVFHLETARKILDEEEPDLRTIPMIRYKFGAFEDLSEILSLLVSKGLISQQGVKTDERILEYQFYVTSLAQEIVLDCSKEFPVMQWYDDRTKLVKKIAGSLGGKALKEKQYQHLEYAQTQLGTIIPSIKEEVIARLRKI